MLKFAILGYGKMGREIEKILLSKGVEVAVVIDNQEDWKDAKKLQLLQNCDVAVEFSQPDMALENLFRCFEMRVPIVCGTTGWHNRLEEVLEICRQKETSFIYGSNFSIGANLFFELNRFAAQLMNRHPQYRAIVEETHHTAKKDAPSGTAITTAKVILEELDSVKDWKLCETTIAPKPDLLPIVAYREGEVAGIHKVTYTSANDDIQISHTAHSRAMLAEGAVKAAIWLVKNPGVYNFAEIFNLV